MKRIIVVGAVILVGLLALPISNLMLDRTPDAELLARVHDPDLTDALPVIMTSCADCHTHAVRKPIYMKIPPARGIIARDIEQAQDRFDMDRELFPGGAGFSQASLAKVEQVLDERSMPPASYRLMHWNAGINDERRSELETSIHHARARANGAKELDDPIYAHAVLPLEPVEDLDPARVELGRRLYHDKRLSGDNTVSCASCHDLSKGGTDRLQYSVGVRNQVGGINAPTTFNSSYLLAQFWDGRAADLAEQADGPPNNPIEMDSNWDQILGKLRRDRELTDAFGLAYGGLSADAVKDAIATYEKTLVTVNAPFDRYLRGDASALTDTQLAGWHRFDALGCDTCHAGPAMGGTSYEPMGRGGRNYFADRGTEVTDADLGRYGVTHDDRDLHRFKVPTLRNIALTYPYFHDGTVESLDEAVRKMALYQHGAELDGPGVDAIVAFLESLTGELDGQPL
jgi:cytochrome c peroxidase